MRFDSRASLRYDDAGRTAASVPPVGPAADEVSLSAVATDLYWTLGLHGLTPFALAHPR